MPAILKIRIAKDATTVMGPGKADLLEAIHRCGSISAAAKDMKMSYRRAWELVDTMNHCFTQPLVTTNPGGGLGSGARVTELGFHILKCYRDIESKTQQHCQVEFDDISNYLAS